MKAEEERKLVAALQSVAYSFKRLVRLLEAQAEQEHPREEKKADAEVYRSGENPEEESAEGRFQRLYRQSRE